MAHAHWGQNLVLDVGVERLPADLLHHHAEQDGVGVAVLESFAGRELIRLREREIQQFVWRERPTRIGEHCLLELG